MQSIKYGLKTTILAGMFVAAILTILHLDQAARVFADYLVVAGN